jgi:hypothetical protein
MINCTDYNSDNCKKGTHITINNDMEEIIVLSCWGVYCQNGQYTVYKKNDEGKIKKSEVIRGQKDVFEGISKYTTINKVSDIYFAGDNIYNYAYPYDYKEEPQEIGFLIDKQLDSFESCYSNIEKNIKRTFIGIGNHDVENCDILNKQLNFKGWSNNGVYFSVNYVKNKNRGVTVIVIDTNVFDPKQENCKGELYTQIDKDKQIDFIKKSYEKAKYRNDWIVIIGHIPALANGHKIKKDSMVIKNKEVYELLEKFKPHIYICGDEHNQQFIYDININVSLAIVGSGGTNLDQLHYKTDESLNPIIGTCYAEQVFGFISLKFNENDMCVKFNSTLKSENDEVIVTNNYVSKIDYESQHVIETYPHYCAEVLKKILNE